MLWTDSLSVVMVIDGKLIATRDAIGERPLYLLKSSRGILIANQMSALSPNRDAPAIFTIDAHRGKMRAENGYP